MERLRHWRRAILAGWQAPIAIVSYVILVVGGSLALAVPWGRRHLLWGILAVLAAIIVIILEGSYKESRGLDARHEDALGKLRIAHQDQLNEALTAAASAHADSRLDPADWDKRCDFTPPDTLMFTLRHRLNNLGAVLAFSDFRCAVSNPEGVLAEASDQNVWVTRSVITARYAPAFFPGASPVRNGMYRYAWDGMDAKGTWHRIAQGTYEVVGAPAPEVGQTTP